MPVTYRMLSECLLRLNYGFSVFELVIDAICYIIGFAEACPNLATIQMTLYKR